MNKKDGVFCYLANKGIFNYFDLTKSLFYLKFNFLVNFKYDVIIFHEDNFNKFFIEIIKIIFKVNFIKIDLNEIYYNNKSKIIIDPELKQYGIGYRSMCQFFFSEIFKHIKGYRYYCRLDTDSFITKKVKHDFFSIMKKNNFKYGYIAEIFETSSAIKYIDDFIKENELINGKPNKILDNANNYNLRCFYTNFEILDTSIFDDEKISLFVNKINSSLNIFNYRWGDAPLRTIMIALFIQEKEIVRFKYLDYKHQIFVQKDGIIFDKNLSIVQLNENPIAGTII